MESRRQLKVASLLQKEINEIFQKKGSFIYGRAFVTLTVVKITPDLLNARIFVSVYNVESPQEIIDTINRNSREVRRLLGHKVRHQLRRIPQLVFELDDSLDDVYRMEEIFKNL